MPQDWQIVDPKPQTNPALERALDAVAASRARTIIHSQSQDKTPPLTYQGCRNGSPLLQSPTGQPFAAGELVTNGALEPGSIAATSIAGNLVRIGGMPRAKTPDQPLPIQKLGNIKYLYGAGDKLWLGGWRKQSVFFRELAPGETIFHASVDNLGGDKFSVNFGYVSEGGVYTLEKWVGFSQSKSLVWSFNPPAPLTPYQCFGHGFWAGLLSEDSVLESHSFSSSSGEGWSTTTETTVYRVTRQYFYAFSATKTDSQNQNTLSSVTFGATLSTVGSNDTHITELTTRKVFRTKKMMIPVDSDLTGLFVGGVEDYSENYRSYLGPGLEFPVETQSSTDTKKQYEVYRINKLGKAGVGGYFERIITTKNNTQVSDTTTRKGAWYAALDQVKRADAAALDPAAHYFDVQTTQPGQFSTLLKEEFSQPFEPPKKVTLTLYSSSFRKVKSEKVSVFGTDQAKNLPFTFYNASYHP